MKPVQLGRQLFRNSIFTLFQVVLSTVVGLALPPIIVSHLGLEKFGVWGMVTLITTYVAMLDFGLGTSMVKLVADARAKGDIEEINVLYGFTRDLYLSLFVVGGGVFLLGAPYITRWLIRAPEAASYTPIVACYGIVALANLQALPRAGVLRGLLRYDRSNTIEMGATLLNAVSTAAPLILGFQLVSLLVGVILSTLWRQAGYYWNVKKELPQLSGRHFQTSHLALYKRLLYFSTSDISVRLYLALSQSAVRFALSYYAGLASVGTYEIARRVVSQVNGLASMIFVPMLPAVSTLVAQGQRDVPSRLIQRAIHYISLIAGPLLCFLMLLYNPLMMAWLGTDNVNAISLAGRFLLLATFIEMFTGPVIESSIGMGSPRLTIVKVGFALVLYMVLVPLLGHELGFIGIVAGEAMAIVLSSWLCLALFQCEVGIPVLTATTKAVTKATVPPLLPAILLWALWSSTQTQQWWHKLPVWSVMIMLHLAATFFIYRRARLITAYEIDLLKGAVGSRAKK